MMRESIDYTSIDSSYELERKKEASVTVQHVDSNDDEDPMLRPPSPLPMISWEPETLSEDPWWTIFYDAYDTFLCLLALTLMVKTSLVIYAWTIDKENHGPNLDKVSSLTKKLIAFNDQVVTGFTIVFVTIVTTFTKRYVLHKAQRGAYISELEQLQASMSLPSTIKVVFSLRRFTTESALLILVWSFYYLGSQASKREYVNAISKPFNILNAASPSSEVRTMIDLYSEDDAMLRENLDRTANPIFFTAKYFLDSDANKPGIDLFGRPVIPDLEKWGALYPDGTQKQSRHLTVGPTSGENLTAYASRPLWVQTFDDSNTPIWYDNQVVGSYSLKTSYFKVNCFNATRTPIDLFPANVLDTMQYTINMTNSANSSTDGRFDVWHRWDTGLRLDDKTSLVGNNSEGVMKLSCTIAEPHIEINVQCEETICRIREAHSLYVAPEQLYNTIFSRYPDFASKFFSNLLINPSIPASRNQTNYMAELLDLSSYISDLVTETATPEKTATTLTASSDQYTQVFNTYFNLMQNIQPEEADITKEAGFVRVERSDAAVYDPYYQIHWEWIAMDYVSGIILLIAAIGSFWLRRHTLAPDIFGYVSTLTRDNPHFPVPRGGSTLDGIERTRALGRMKVKLGDVAGPDGGVGRVGFLPIHPTFTTETLSRERKYV